MPTLLTFFCSRTITTTLAGALASSFTLAFSANRERREGKSTSTSSLGWSHTVLASLYLGSGSQWNFLVTRSGGIAGRGWEDFWRDWAWETPLRTGARSGTAGPTALSRLKAGARGEPPSSGAAGIEREGAGGLPSIGALGTTREGTSGIEPAEGRPLSRGAAGTEREGARGMPKEGACGIEGKGRIPGATGIESRGAVGRLAVGMAKGGAVGTLLRLADSGGACGRVESIPSGGAAGMDVAEGIFPNEGARGIPKEGARGIAPNRGAGGIEREGARGILSVGAWGTTGNFGPCGIDSIGAVGRLSAGAWGGAARFPVRRGKEGAFGTLRLVDKGSSKPGA